MIETFAGNGAGGFSGDGGLATNASIGTAAQGCFDKEGNYYFSVRNQHRIRKVAGDGTISTIAGNGTPGFSGDGNISVNAIISNPLGICIDDSNNIYFADHGNERIRKIDAVSGIITTIAGNGTGSYSGDGGPAINASLSSPVGVCFDQNGNMYIADASNHRVRKIDALHVITTIAGTGTNGFSGDGQLALNAHLADPLCVICDSFGNVFICDFGNKRIRKVDIVSGNITTVVGGTGSGIYNGENIPASTAEISSFGIVFNSIGEMFLSDQNQRIRKVDYTGIIHTVAGTGIAGYSGDGNLATLAQIYNPEGMAVDSCDNIYFCETANRIIRKIKFNECFPVHFEITKKHANIVEISPNPATSQLTITSNTKLKHVTVTNALGITVRRAEKESDKIVLDISDLSSGIYFVKAVDVNGALRTEKIIKQ